MSIFKEGEWEDDDTGDKLTKELFLSKKKAKPVKKTLVNNEQSGAKLKKNDKKKPQIIRSGDSGELDDRPDARNKTNNKKRKSSAIEIDETMIKKWKSISQALPREDANSLQKGFKEKTKKLNDRSTGNMEKKSSAKKRDSEAKETPDKLQKKKKSNETDSKTDSNVMTKSQKRRLKHKEKLLNSQKGLTSKETLLATEEKDGEKNVSDSDGFSTDVKASKKSDKSRLKIDRLKRLLIDKQRSSSKNEENITEPKSLRDRMLARLKSSRFRYLNEQMYNNESWSSKKYFKEDPDAFVAYHEGYKLQVDQWPLNPLDTIIASVKRLPKDYVVADFGCGEARLADSVAQKVHSLDLVAINDRVTACDMAHTSLLTSRIDVVVFCLSLMGTNLADYLIEANRVLRKDGILKIAEVESRFEDVDEFVKILSSYGFVNTWKDLSHNLFYFMDFKKEGDITKKRNKLPPVALKSCLYKRR